MRDMFVGSRSRLMAAGAYHMPRLLDKGMERFMYRLMKTDQPVRNRDDNNLHAYTADLQERGGVGGPARNVSVYTSAATHPFAARAALLGTGLALAAMWQARRRQTV